MAIRCSLGFIHVCCLVTSNKIVAAESLHSFRACSTHAVQASRCNYYIHVCGTALKYMYTCTYCIIQYMYTCTYCIIQYMYVLTSCIHLRSLSPACSVLSSSLVCRKALLLLMYHVMYSTCTCTVQWGNGGTHTMTIGSSIRFLDDWLRIRGEISHVHGTCIACEHMQHVCTCT